MLTKLDGDARGGAALSIATVTGKPVMFASNGEKLDDFDVFHPERMASRILGMGDVLTLIEQAEKTFDREQAEAMAAKLVGGGDFTLEDFLVPDAGGTADGLADQAARDAAGHGGHERADRAASTSARSTGSSAIIQSMTPAERRDPKILNGSRRARIARGSGTEVSDVNGLVERFDDARKMMAVDGPGRPAVAARDAAGHGRRRHGSRSRQAQPAGQAGQEAQARQRQPGQAGPSRSARRPRAGPRPADATRRPPRWSFELPDELKRRLLPPS